MNFIDTLLILIIIMILIVHLTKGDIFNFIYQLYINFKNKILRYTNSDLGYELISPKLNPLIQNIMKKKKKKNKKQSVFIKLDKDDTHREEENFNGSWGLDDISLPPIEFTDF